MLSKTFSAKGFDPNQVLTLTIVKVVAEEVGQDREIKPVIYVKEDTRGLVVNRTNYDRFAKATGTSNTDNWIGVRFELSYDAGVQFGGKEVGGLRVKPLKGAAGGKKD